MRTTYKDLFDKYSTGVEIDDQIYSVTDELYIQTPSGPQRIEVVFKKQGTGVELTLENGDIIRCEQRHAVMTSKGLQFAKDATDILHADGFKRVVSTSPSDDVEFYDIGIPAPHLYYDTFGYVHHNTYTIMKTIQEKGLVKGKDYVKLSGKASPVEIYKTLFMFRDKGLVVFDDLDSMWRNEDATNILKAALDTSPVREISWVSAQTINVGRMSDEQKSELFKKIDKQINGESIEDEEPLDDDEDDEGDGKKKKKGATSAQTFNPDKLKYPSMFDFTGRVIFISNLKKEEFDSAIMSRSAKINMDMTPQQILARMRNILPTLGGDDVALKQKEELLDHLILMYGRKEITAVTMREFTKGLDIVRSGVPNWKELVIYS